MLAMQALMKYYLTVTLTLMVLGRSHRNPVANIVETPIFLFIGIWSFAIETIGRSSMAKSDTTLIVPPATNTLSLFRQVPGTEGSHSLRLGMQGHISIGIFAI